MSLAARPPRDAPLEFDPGELRILDAMTEGVTVEDSGGRLLYANAAAATGLGFKTAAELLNVPVEDVMGRFELLDRDGNAFERDALPARTAFRTGTAVPETTIRFRVVATGEERWSAMRAVPMLDAGGRVKCAVTVFRDVTDLMRVEAERASLLDSEQRARAHAERIAKAEAAARARAEAAQERLSFLADASRVLGGSLSYRNTLAQLARLVVPRLADWCAIDALEGDSLHLLEVAHVDPAKVDLARTLRTKYPPDPNAEYGVAHVIRTGRSELRPVIDDDTLVRAARDDEHLEILRGDRKSVV